MICSVESGFGEYRAKELKYIALKWNLRDEKQQGKHSSDAQITKTKQYNFAVLTSGIIKYAWCWQVLSKRNQFFIWMGWLHSVAPQIKHFWYICYQRVTYANMAFTAFTNPAAKHF